MRFSAAPSILFFLPSIHAFALPYPFHNKLESTYGSQRKQDTPLNVAPRSPQPGKSLLEATAAETDDPSLDPSSLVKRDLSARNPQGPNSNPGEFIDPSVSNFNPANHHSFGRHGDRHPDRNLMNANDDGSGTQYQRHYNSSHHHQQDRNSSHHQHRWNTTRHEHHRKEGILTAFNSHGEHIVVYNGTHYPNGTSYRPANTTSNGGTLLGETVINGDDIVVYRQPWNRTHHHRYHYNLTNAGDATMPTATTAGIWLPSGTAWIPNATGYSPPLRGYYRHVPSAANPGFRGPRLPKKWRVWRGGSWRKGRVWEEDAV